MTVGGSRRDCCPTAVLPGRVGRDGGGDSSRACLSKDIVDLPRVGSLGADPSVCPFFSRFGGSGGREAGSYTGALTRDCSPEDAVLAVPFVRAEAVQTFETDETAETVEASDACDARRLCSSGRSEGLLGGSDGTGDSTARPSAAVDEASEGLLDGKDGVSVGLRGGKLGTGGFVLFVPSPRRGGALGGDGLSVGRRAGRTGGGLI